MFNNLFYRVAKLKQPEELDAQSFLTKWYIKNPNLPDMK
ncbi:MAG: hypothetical protein RLZ10_1446, partial [Bacteroidota bacterium]